MRGRAEGSTARNSRRKLIVLSTILVLLAVIELPVFPARSFPVSFSHALASGADSAPVSTSTRAGRLAVFDDVWETINERYYDPDFGGIDWEAGRLAFRRAAMEASGSHELYEVLRRMIAALNDVHTRVYAPEEKFDWWNPRVVGVGLTIREIEGTPTVVKVNPKLGPARAGVRPGDVIESIDGIPASSLIQQRLSERSGSTAARAGGSRIVATMMEGVPDSAVTLTWRGKDGQTRYATFQRRWNQRQLGVHIGRKRKFLVIEIEAFTDRLALSVMRALKDKIHGVDGIVLDLRENGGGDADATAEFASAFLGGGINLGRFTDRVGGSIQLTTHSKSMLAAAPIPRIDLPLVILTSERTSSAAEILTAVLQARGRATVIGGETCGCVLAIRARHNLPDGGVLDVSEFDYRTPSGVRLQGRGVEPDETVEQLRSDLYGRHDRALALALERLKQGIQASRR